MTNFKVGEDVESLQSMLDNFCKYHSRWLEKVVVKELTWNTRKVGDVKVWNHMCGVRLEVVSYRKGDKNEEKLPTRIVAPRLSKN